MYLTFILSIQTIVYFHDFFISWNGSAASKEIQIVVNGLNTRKYRAGSHFSLSGFFLYSVMGKRACIFKLPQLYIIMFFPVIIMQGLPPFLIHIT